MKYLFLALLLAGCTPLPEQPQYMADALRSPEVALDGIRAALGPGFRARQINGVFFVATNADPGAVKEFHETIVSVDEMLHREFFARRTERPIRVFLFRDKDTYDEYVINTYGHAPTTRFGFYVSGERKIVLNAATGTGTLAHELTHPLLSEDFPGLPPWFNEGFASLFERYVTSESGRPTALVNWRLPDLRSVLRDGRSGLVRPLLAMNYDEFYDFESGLHYAVARHLCLWLQDQGRLKSFYDRFKASYESDPTGAATLMAVTGMSMDRIESKWREYVLGLEFR